MTVSERNELALKNQKLIWKVINDVYSGFRNLDQDMYQVGFIALMKAVEKYKEDSNVAFSTYAYIAIMRGISRYLVTEYPLKVGVNYYNRHHKKLDDICFVRMDQLIENTNATIGDILPSKVDVEDEAIANYVVSIIADKSNDSQKETLELLMNEYTLREIGNRFGLSHQAIDMRRKRMQRICMEVM